MNETAKDLWRIARELRDGPGGAWLTTAASIWIVLLAACSVARRLCLGVERLWQRLRDVPQQSDSDEFPEGA